MPQGMENLGKSLSALCGELKKTGENHPAPQNPTGNHQKRNNGQNQSRGKSGK